MKKWKNNEINEKRKKNERKQGEINEKIKL